MTSGDPVLFLSNPGGIDNRVRRRMLDALGRLNQKHFAQIGDPEIETTVAQQELAFRMQSSVPELTDISGEPEHVIDLYGPEVHKNGSFARNCLLARRMVERGCASSRSSTGGGITTPFYPSNCRASASTSTNRPPHC